MPAGGSGTPWSLNDNHTLVWGGKPYLPVGVQVDGSPGAVKAAKAAGIQDVVVDLPASGAGWDETLAALREADMRYLIRLDSLAPTAKGFAVEPQSYRITGITAPQTVTLDLPGATSAYVVLASRRDSSIASSARVPVVNGKITYEAKPGGEIEHVLLVYPETSSLVQPDYWEGMDVQRDTLLNSLRRHAPGPGLRGIVNPLGQTLGLPGRELEFVPTSAYFRMEFRDMLEKRYHAVKTVMQSWGMGTNDLETFEDLARLVPLWRGSRGVGLLLDPVTNKTYAAESKRSLVWADLAEAVNAAGVRRFGRYVSGVRMVANVPIVQEWAGWAAAYESSNSPLDGVGMRTLGTAPEAIVASGCRATSSICRWSTPGWLPATNVDLGAGENVAGQLTAVLDDVGSLGARGCFVRADSPEVMKAVAAEAAKRKDDVSLAAAHVQALYFPENALNPAFPQRLPFGLWWLPSPVDGNRIDLGTMFSGYRMTSQSGSVTVLWAKQPGRYKIRLANPKTVVFQATDGHNLDPKLAKDGVEVNLTDMPTIVTGTEEIPVPEISFAETLFRFDMMMDMATRSMRDITEERIYFKDYVNGFDRNPGGSFNQMRTQLVRLGAKVGNVAVVEIEKSPETNFSEVANVPGCSGGGALVLRTPIAPGPQGYFVEVTVPSKSRDEQEVWLSASIPLEKRHEITVSVNGQLLPLTGEPVGTYGDGYGWYKLGVTRLGGDPVKVRIMVSGAASAPIALDSLVLTPRPFKPLGPYPPDPIEFPPLPHKK